jgi:hypothetical protein
MTSKKQKDLQKEEHSKERFRKLSTEQILKILAMTGDFGHVPLSIKKAYKAILKERGIDRNV